MFKKKLKDLSKKIGEEEIKTFYVLTHKKYRREIYFQNNQKAINFIKQKLENPSSKKFRKIKHLTYILIKLKLLQIFLKKVKLSSKFGEVIFVAGQIKGFDLYRKEVLSFPNEKDKKFIKFKKFQKKIAVRGFAPKIYEINKNIPYSKEELLEGYPGGKDIEVFKKLYLFYNQNNVKEIASKKYAKKLFDKFKQKKFSNVFLLNVLKKFLNSDKKLLISTIHGDFAKEQILIEGGDYVFVDWSPRKDLIVSDLITFLRGEENLLENKKFLKILEEVFPKEIQKNIKEYIILNEISKIIRIGKINELSIKRIKKCFNESAEN